MWLAGQISNFKPHPSGHFYFSLKDSTAQISAAMFRGFNSALRFKPEDGMAIVRGKVTVYEPRGNYQIMCEMMEPVGAGALQKAFEQLKRKLEVLKGCSIVREKASDFNGAKAYRTCDFAIGRCDSRYAQCLRSAL